MPFIACPKCAERGKIGSNLVGARIKCRKCGTSFVVSPPASSDVDPSTLWGADKAPITYEGIEVEGLDSASWTTTEPQATGLAEQPAVASAAPAAEPSSAFIAASPPTGQIKQYKILTTKDKFFDGKFDLGRLEDALNHFAREGWVAKGIATPQIKGFTGVIAEELVVLLER